MIWSILDGALVGAVALGLVIWQLVSLSRDMKKDESAAPPRDPIREHPLDDG